MCEQAETFCRKTWTGLAHFAFELRKRAGLAGIGLMFRKELRGSKTTLVFEAAYFPGSRHSEVTSWRLALCRGSGDVSRLRMLRSDIAPPKHFKPCLINPVKQILARTQAKMLGEVGQDQPSFAIGRQMGGQAIQEPFSMRLSGSYTACSRIELGLPGSHGGLHTISGAWPGG